MPLPLRAVVPAVLVLALAAACSAPPPAGHSARVPGAPPGGAHPDGTAAEGLSPDGGSAGPGKARAGATAPTLRATLATPTDIDLSWRGAPGSAGHVLEFATEEAGPYTVLKYLPPGATAYRHPDLIPRTTFFYRLRAFQGPASAPVDVSLPAGGLTAADEEAGHDWLPPRTVPGRSVTGHSVRDGGAAAPSGLTAEIKHANGILFIWTDHASDEAGHLLEARPRGSSAYDPVVVLDRDINSTGLITLPTEKRASYRVRAFLYGAESNVVRLTTGDSTAAPE
ncbi:fibronectin type III domain-containing protein [Streptomyces sp. NPDC002018]|uniref:fibronectin type III domain-containing protein n=1 Tax=Streptomyces sp. NPDC002018 TaxID=3364629 RepID=UPI0036C7607C